MMRFPSPRPPRLLVGLAALVGVAALVAAQARPARAATEWVLILDNSTSMSDGSTLTMSTGEVKQLPAQDPDRLAVIATLVFRAFLGPDDRLTILTLDSSRLGAFATVPTDPAAIRSLRFNQATFFVGPLREARRILEASAQPRKILLLATDGAPSQEEAMTGAQARELLGLDPGPAGFQVISLGLSTDPWTREAQTEFLAPLGRLEHVESARALVDAFTRIFAESLRSRPETGRIEPGGRQEFAVGRYVTEVLVGVATERRSGPFEARVSLDGKALDPADGGDSGCAAPPCHAYQVFKAPHDPARPGILVLELPRSGGPVAYGFILRYDLGAEIVSAPAGAKVGEEIDVVARMTWRGSTFNDPGFFEADGFEAVLALGEARVPLTRREDGSFTARIKAEAAGAGPLEARFSNRWISLSGARPLQVEEWLPLTLVVAPPDFGAWTGGRGPSKRCVDVSLAGSVNADKLPLEAFAEGLGPGYRLEAPAPLPVQGDKVTLCLVAPGCCEAAPAGARLVVRGQDPHYHPGAASVPITARVARTPFVTCWWPHICAGIGAIVFLVVVVGFVRPRDFPAEEVIRLAKTEQALARASARRLRDLPDGRRGFYRDARVAFDASGNAVRGASGAVIVLRAARGDPQLTVRGSLEQKDPRTRKFQPVDLGQGPGYLRRGIVYRVGEFFLRLG